MPVRRYNQHDMENMYAKKICIMLLCCILSLTLQATTITTATTIATAIADNTTTTLAIASSSSSSKATISTSNTTDATGTGAAPIHHQHYHRPKKVCPGVHIRNDLKSFEQLKGCEIIDGPLTIALVANHTHPYELKDYENITFPELIEVTDYLLFFRVTGLTTFAKLFPNLSVIRGRELVSNYALIIYEMLHLQKINLPNLTDILRGSVRIESNPNLCYTSTVNWEAICKHTFTPHFIKDNNARCDNRCPDHCLPWNLNTKSSSISDPTTKLQGDIKELGANNNRSLFCWSNQVCHESCVDPDGNSPPIAPNGGCCSSQCAGGCYERDRPDRCVACRSVSQGDKCVEHCNSDSYEYKGRCIKADECEKMVENVQQSQCNGETEYETSIFKTVRVPGDKHGKCQTSCPPGSEEDPTNRSKCKSCDKGKCRKVCTPPQGSDKPYMVTNVNSLRLLTGCNVINGSLEISMKGGKNVLHELETVFQELEEIRGYLKITRSYPILTLEFLQNLRAINGSELDRGQYSLIIIDNPNLQELFMFNQSDSNQKQLNILKGKIFAHLNPKLCPQKIDNLKKYASVADWDERDVSRHTNGDKEACNTEKLNVQFVHGTARIALIRFQNYASKLEDPRTLLYYLINYREAPNGSVTMFDGRDGCNSQNDVWWTVEEYPVKPQVGRPVEYQEVIIKVKPATRYALYVKTFTILAESKGALSDIIYFETAPDTPGIPRQIESSAISSNSVAVSWLPPSRPNGNIVRYFVTIKSEPEQVDFQNLDVCGSIDSRNELAQSLTKNELSQSSLVPSSNSNNGSSTSDGQSANTCSKYALETDPDIQVEQVTFQDIIIDIVYLKQPCAPTNSSKPARKRRSIEHDLNVTESMSENSLPRKPIPVLSFSDTTTQDASSSNKSADEANAPQQNQPAIIRFDSLLGKTEADMTVSSYKADTRLAYTITDLTHFSLYTIEVVACHGEFNGGRTKTSKSYSKCSLQAITQVRTLPIPENDRVNRSTITFSLANETFSDNIVSWRGPESPNGQVLAYRIRYRPKNSNSQQWNEVCINSTEFNQNRGLVMSNVNSGSYVLGVQTVSMYPSQRFWSDEIEFEIPQNSLSPVTLTLIIIVGIALLAFGIVSGAYCFQKNARDDLIYASVNPDYVQYDPDEWEIEKSKLIVGPQIGTGSFGLVHKGQLITEKGVRECAVKTVPPTSTAKQRMDFLREASMMKRFDTFHVVKLLGVVSVTTPVYVIMEYMANGDLKAFLRNQREAYQKQNKSLVDGIYLMATQIADGMAYLAAEKFIHRDLAARNCMVGENRVVKIGDFGLTRDVYENEYYRRDTSCRLPVRWMAPESLKDNMYTTASDVWSYGIVLWEIVTFSEYPYQGLSNDEVIKRVIQGYTMPRPENCPDKLYTIMEKCWRKTEKDRPSFLGIVEYLLPETEGKLYPNCFYRKPTVEGDSIAQTVSEEITNGTESYPLLSWPSSNQRANGLINGDNHINNHQSSGNDDEKDH